MFIDKNKYNIKLSYHTSLKHSLHCLETWSKCLSSFYTPFTCHMFIFKEYSHSSQTGPLINTYIMVYIKKTTVKYINCYHRAVILSVNCCTKVSGQHIITAGGWWWLTHTKPRSLDTQLRWRTPYSGGWETWSPLQSRKTECPQRGPGKPRCGRSRAHWSLSDPCCGGLSSWHQSRRGSMTYGCSRYGNCHRSLSSWCLCRRFQWKPPPHSSLPPSSKLLQRGAPYTEPEAGSRTWQGCHCKTGGLSWGQLFCSLETSRAVCRLCFDPEWAGTHLEDKLNIYLKRGNI